MKRLTLLLLLSLIYLLSGMSAARADHMVGTTISWKSLGSDTFRVTVSNYRDCNGIAAVNIPIDVTPTCYTNYNFEVKGTTTSGQDITPVAPGQCTRCSNSACSFGYGVQEFVITYKLVLPDTFHCCTFNISWYQCCRSEGITTGGTWNSYYTQSTINRCVTPQDNSPCFGSSPVVMFCKKQCVTYNTSVNDDDPNDSLVFKLVDPLQVSGTSVVWDTNYSKTEPIAYDGWPGNPNATWSPPSSCKGFHLNSQTGELDFKATKNEWSVVAIAVEEWRKDSTGKMVKIGEVRRDFQLIILDCGADQAPTLSRTGSDTSSVIHFYEGQQKCFTVSSDDPDTKDTVKVDWDKGIKGASYQVDTNKQHPKATFCWKPDSSDVRPYPYHVVVSAIDRNTPIPGRTTKTFSIYVYPAPEIQAKVKVHDCGIVDFKGINTGSLPVDKWVWKGDVSSSRIAYGDSVSWKYTDTGWHYYSLTAVNNHLSYTPVIEDSIYIHPYVQVHLPQDTTICAGTTLKIRASHALGLGPYDYTWSTGQQGRGLDSLLLHVTKDTAVALSIHDSAGCSNYDSMYIFTKEQPLPLLGADKRACAGDTVVLNSGLKGMKKIEWYKLSSGKLDAEYTGDNFPVTESGTYCVRALNTTGCEGWDTIIVNFNLPVQVASGIRYGCSGQNVMIPANAGSGAKYFEWKDSAGKLLSSDSTLMIRSLAANDTLHYNLCAWSDTVQGVFCHSCGSITLVGQAVTAASADSLPERCDNDLPLDLSSYGHPPGGRWNSASYPDAISGNKLYFGGSHGLTAGNHLLTYTYINSYGCADDTIVTMHVNSCGGSGILTNPNIWQNIHIYPNPAQTLIQVSAPTQILQLNIWDLQGRCLIRYLNTSQADISSLAQGIYQLEVITKSGRAIKSFIKQN